MAQSEIKALGVVKVGNPIRSIEKKRALSLMIERPLKGRVKMCMCQAFLAKTRLHSLEKKFENNPDIRERYAKSIEDDIEKGYVKKQSKGEVQCDSNVVWFSPHRFVINPKKPDSLRRVYDASAKFMRQSLNDEIYTGPDLLTSPFGVFLSDKPAARFLWRESSEKELSVYQFERTVFGEVSVPSRANYTMRRNADENGADLPLDVRAVYG
ncbi:hypothetical protein ACROYT_G007140 [Oculina patagonica]